MASIVTRIHLDSSAQRRLQVIDSGLARDIFPEPLPLQFDLGTYPYHLRSYCNNACGYCTDLFTILDKKLHGMWHTTVPRHCLKDAVVNTGFYLKADNLSPSDVDQFLTDLKKAFDATAG